MLVQLKASKDARVLSVLSAGVHKAYPEYRLDPELKKNFRCEINASWYGAVSFHPLPCIGPSAYRCSRLLQPNQCRPRRWLL